MTEQNTAYRTDLDPAEEEDPLAELARIVAGEPAQKPEPVANATEAGDGPSPEADFDIESALMQELGSVAAASSAHDEGAAVQQVEPAADVAQPTPFVSRATPVAPVVTNTLEDQLMAELSPSDDLSDDTMVAASQNIAPPAVSEDTQVEEAVLNAVRDVEAASAEMAAAQTVDPFAEVEQAANAVRQETGISASAQGQADPEAELEDFFSEGFEDLLSGDDAAANNVADTASAAVDAEIDDLEEAFTAAFDEQLKGEAAAAVAEDSIQSAAIDQPHQDELALENEFARSFAEELGADQPIVGNDAASLAPAAAQEPLGQRDYPDFQEAPVHADSMAEPAEASGSSGGFKMAVGALGVALLLGMGVVGWGYYSGSGSSEPVVVRADAEPAKVKPENPGGEQIANQDNEVYNRVAGNASGEPTQETLITSREETVAVAPKSDNRLTPDAGADSSAQTAPLGISPKRVRTLTVKPDGTILPATQTINTTDVADATPSSDAPAVQSDQAAGTAPQSADSGGSTIGIDGAQTTGALAVPQPSPLPAAQQLAVNAVETPAAPTTQTAPVQAAAPAPAQTQAPAADPNAPTQIASLETQASTPTVASSEWKIQVSSQRSREAAEASFTNLQRRFSSILGGRSAMIQQADIEGKGTFFRAKVLAESKADATRLCSRLKSAGGSCFVTR